MESTYIEFTEKGIVQVKKENVNADSLGPSEVIIENETSIISAGTELARLNGMEKGQVFPFRPGYGSIGRIVSIGSHIQGYNIGDRVFYAGRHASVQRFKHGENHQWAYLFPVPKELDPMEAAVGCMAQIAMTAPNITELKLEDTVAVFGLGMVGILTAMMYKLRGARVFGVDPIRERCEVARKAGIDEVIDAPSDQQMDTLLRLTKNNGFNVTVDAVGHPAVIKNCIQSTAFFGQIILLGSPRSPFSADMTPLFSDIHHKGLVVRGAHMWRYPVQPQRGCTMSVEWAFQSVYELILSKRLDVRSLISHVIPPEEVPSAYEGLQNRQAEYTCVIIDWRK